MMWYNLVMCASQCFPRFPHLIIVGLNIPNYITTLQFIILAMTPHCSGNRHGPRFTVVPLLPFSKPNRILGAQLYLSITRSPVGGYPLLTAGFP